LQSPGKRALVSGPIAGPVSPCVLICPTGRSPSRPQHVPELSARRKVGYDYVHCAIDDHPAWPTPRSPRRDAATCAGFLRAAAALVRHGRRQPDRTRLDRRRHGLPPEPSLPPSRARPRRQITLHPRSSGAGRASRFSGSSGRGAAFELLEAKAVMGDGSAAYRCWPWTFPCLSVLDRARSPRVKPGR
jgi:hypothetical protein